jgi:anti-sigma B factor antagonist
MDFSVKTKRLGDTRYVVGVTGEVDMHSGREFKRALLALVENGGRELVIDLTDVSFIDSTFLNTVVNAQARLNGTGQPITIVCPNRGLARLFELTGLDRMFTICRTPDGAPRWAKIPAEASRPNERSRGSAVLA